METAEVANDTTRRHRLLTRWGIAATSVWLAGLLIWGVLCWAQFAEMSPDRWGSLFAGVFTMPALLWVVIGYFQQGEELRLQVHELQHQVAATNRLAESAQDESRHRTAAAQPMWDVTIRTRAASGRSNVYIGEARDSPAPIRNLELREVRAGEGVEVSLIRSGIPEGGRHLGVEVTGDAPAWFELAYLDVYQTVHGNWFRFHNGVIYVLPYDEQPPRSDDDAPSVLRNARRVTGEVSPPRHDPLTHG